jgi:hypothetical protein
MRRVDSGTLCQVLLRYAQRRLADIDIQRRRYVRFLGRTRHLRRTRIGNAVATMVIARWEPGGRDEERFREVLDDPSLIEDIDVPEEYETPEEYEESHRPAALTH